MNNEKEEKNPTKVVILTEVDILNKKKVKVEPSQDMEIILAHDPYAASE
jgi:hypothetical protein